MRDWLAGARKAVVAFVGTLSAEIGAILLAAGELTVVTVSGATALALGAALTVYRTANAAGAAELRKQLEVAIREGRL
jgi:hypothetical protein